MFVCPVSSDVPPVCLSVCFALRLSAFSLSVRLWVGERMRSGRDGGEGVNEIGERLGEWEEEERMKKK